MSAVPVRVAAGVQPVALAEPRPFPSPEQALDGLDEAQRAAVLAPAGPVCVLAGAGTGKTRTITHRIAYRVLTGETQPKHVLTVTFTARAAAQLRDRLRALSVSGVQARTFHAAALRQLRYFAPRVFGGRELPELLETKARIVGQAAARSGVRADRAMVRDLTGEIEWAKSTLIEPDGYQAAAAAADRELPVTAEQLAAVYATYEQTKRRAGLIDFEDLLRATVWAIEEHSDVAEQVRAQYRHFVVDEYQDVNPLQQRLLLAWLGGRRDLCVVGDASQTIYSFTGATSRYLVDFGHRHQGGVVIRLERDYRSTPQVVALANEVISQATGAEAKLRLRLIGQRPPGPQPVVVAAPDEPAEAAAVADRCRELLNSGTPAAEMAVLFRANAQSEAYERALADAGVPYVVRGGERFFDRPEIKEAVLLLRGAARSADVPDGLVEAVAEVLAAAGHERLTPPAGGAARERWEALAALLGLAEDLVAARPETTLVEFVDELAGRAAAQHAPTVQGVTLASLHAAKGLEWDAVFLVGLSDGSVPITYAKTTAALEEERRLLYVGITRAREQLWLSWSAARTPGGRAGRRPSRFLPELLSGPGGSGGSGGSGGGRGGSVGRVKGAGRRERTLPTCRVCGAALFDPRQRKLRRCESCPMNVDEELYDRLREWRTERATEQKVPAFVVFTDATLTAIAEDKPIDLPALAQIPGVGPGKLSKYGDDVLALVAARLGG